MPVAHKHEVTASEILSRVLRPLRDVAAPGEQTSNRDILIDRFPVQAGAADLDLRALSRRCVEQARKPGEWDAKRAPIGEIDPHGVVVKLNTGCGNAHATLSG